MLHSALEENWNRILQSKVEVPMNVLRLYDENGDLISYCVNENPPANKLQSETIPSDSASSGHLELSVCNVDIILSLPCNDRNIGSKNFSPITNELDNDFQVYDKTTSTSVAARKKGSIPCSRLQSLNFSAELNSDDVNNENITSPAPHHERSDFGGLNISPIPGQLHPDFQISGKTSSTPIAARDKENVP